MWCESSGKTGPLARQRVPPLPVENRRGACIRHPRTEPGYGAPAPLLRRSFRRMTMERVSQLRVGSFLRVLPKRYDRIDRHRRLTIAPFPISACVLAATAFGRFFLRRLAARNSWATKLPPQAVCLPDKAPVGDCLLSVLCWGLPPDPVSSRWGARRRLSHDRPFSRACGGYQTCAPSRDRPHIESNSRVAFAGHPVRASAAPFVVCATPLLSCGLLRASPFGRCPYQCFVVQGAPGAVSRRGHRSPLAVTDRAGLCSPPRWLAEEAARLLSVCRLSRRMLRQHSSATVACGPS